MMSIDTMLNELNIAFTKRSNNWSTQYITSHMVSIVAKLDINKATHTHTDVFYEYIKVNGLVVYPDNVRDVLDMLHN